SNWHPGGPYLIQAFLLPRPGRIGCDTSNLKNSVRVGPVRRLSNRCSSRMYLLSTRVSTGRSRRPLDEGIISGRIGQAARTLCNPYLNLFMRSHHGPARFAKLVAPHAKKAKAAKPKKEKKVSALDASAKVLGEAGAAMNCPAMIEAMAAKGYWKSPGGQ